jgi:flagellar biosynthesis regulator FlaF
MSTAAYEDIDQELASGRDLEARVLLRSAMRLQQAITATDPEQLHVAVSLNNKLWLLFYSEIEEKRVSLPPEIEQNIIRLAAYILSVAPQAFARDKTILETLVSINRRIAAGLYGKPADSAVPPATTNEPAVGLSASA